MNIFMMPSWYPTASEPAKGIFFQDYAIALSKHISPINITICALQIHHMTLPPKRLYFEALREQATGQPDYQQVNSNITEIRHPHLTGPGKPFNMFSKRTFKAYERIFRKGIQNSEDYSVIWAHVASPAGYHALMLGKKYNIPVVITEHMGPFPLPAWTRSGRLAPTILSTYRGASCVVSVSSDLAKKIAQHAGIQSDIIPNPIREEFFTSKQRQTNNPSAPFEILAVARLTHVKGIDLLLRAMQLLSARGDKDIHLTIVGDGPLREDLRTLTSTLCISEKVTWAGPQPPNMIVNFMKESDLFVLPSRSETFGVACGEAQAVGLPVVTTKCGGPEDIVCENTGEVAETEDPIDLADKLAKARREYSKYDPIFIRRNAEKMFSEKSIAFAYKALFQRIIP